MSRATRIGVDIGATAVRAAELSMRSVPPALVRAAQVPLEPGAVAGGAGALIALARGGSRKDTMPFGPYMAAGAVVAALFAPQVARWYTALGR